MTVQRLRAPQEDRGIVAEPALDAVEPLLAANRQRLSQSLHFFGKPWQVLREEARRATLAAAADYLRAAGEPAPTMQGDLLFLAGHQPEIFHPGVWAKNFALCGLAQKHGAISVNLVVDNDTAKSTALHVPAGEHVASAPIDHWQGDVPYEERAVLDEELFATVPERVRPLVKSWPFVPLLEKFWPDVLRQGKRTNLLGERIAAARRTWERRWGCHQYEAPLSALCRTTPFAWFACHLLGDLERFRGIYNDAVHAYRREHGIRSAFHPVPDLAKDGDWLEAPFWAWRTGQHRRERLFARTTGGKLDLRLGKEVVSLPSPEHAMEAWQDLERQGIKIRTRALTTTMFARLLVGDLFMHGIGGGKYDELTDAILRRFHGVEPPGFMVLSATMLLPLPRYGVSVEDVRHFAWQRRDWWWNPQRHLAGNGRVGALREAKDAWIGRAPANLRERAERFRGLRAVTEELRELGREDVEEAGRRAEQSRHDLAVNRVLMRRDYPFCLFPEEDLAEFMRGFL